VEVIGAIIALVIAGLTVRQLILQNRKTKLEIKKLELEIKKLRRGG